MHGYTDVMTLFLDSLYPKTEKLSLEETMDLSRERLILELETYPPFMEPEVPLQTVGSNPDPHSSSLQLQLSFC
jgi:hypothetical protein